MLRGIDISAWQGTIDWPQVPAAGYTFAGIKLSEGVGYVDPTFAANWAGARAAGLIPLAYHFARPDLNGPASEAAYFLSLLPALETGDITILDLETGRGMDRSSWALGWLAAVELSLGFPPMLYADREFVTNWLADPALARFPLLLASYSATIPPSIGVWTQGAAMWQFTDALAVPGIEGPVDGDLIARDLAGLKALGKPPTHHVALSTCALKAAGPDGRPSHVSPVAIDPQHRPVYLARGEEIIPVGDPVTTDDTWQRVRLPDSPVWGWVPAARIGNSL